MDNELFEIAQQLGQLLKSKEKKIATAESCTGGWIAQSITEVSGSSAWFDRAPERPQRQSGRQQDGPTPRR